MEAQNAANTERMGITMRSLRRIQRRAGVKNSGKDTLEITKRIMSSFLEDIVSKSAAISTYLKKKTIQPEHVIEALRSNGIYFVASLNDFNKTKSSSIKKPDLTRGAVDSVGAVDGIALISTTPIIEKPTKSRSKPGSLAIREIKKEQNSSDKLILPFAPLSRFIRKLSAKGKAKEMRFSQLALIALQVAIEDYLVKIYQDSVLCSLHAGRRKVISSDVYLVMAMRGINIKS